MGKMEIGMFSFHILNGITDPLTSYGINKSGMSDAWQKLTKEEKFEILNGYKSTGKLDAVAVIELLMGEFDQA